MPGTYGFSVSFRAAYQPPPLVTDTLSGEAARKSEQVQTVMKFYDALRREDLDAIRPLVHPEGDILRQVEVGEGNLKGKAMLDWIAAKIPCAPIDVPANVERVVVFDDLAMVLMKHRHWEALIKRDGVWTIDDRD
jgi:hypothetical protein